MACPAGKLVGSNFYVPDTNAVYPADDESFLPYDTSATSIWSAPGNAYSVATTGTFYFYAIMDVPVQAPITFSLKTVDYCELSVDDAQDVGLSTLTAVLPQAPALATTRSFTFVQLAGNQPAIWNAPTRGPTRFLTSLSISTLF